jgi:hypothetical protein
MFYNTTQIIMMFEDRWSTAHHIPAYEIKILEASFIPKHLAELIDDIL